MILQIGSAWGVSLREDWGYLEEGLDIRIGVIRVDVRHLD